MSAQRLTFAVAPTTIDDQTLRALDELCTLLSADTGVEIVPRAVESSDELGDLLALGEVELAWISPTLLLMSPGLSTMVPLLSSVRQGKAYFHAILFTAHDSDIQGVDDLQGARAAWVAPSSASGYIVPRLVLARQGVDVTHVFSRERFMGGHGAVAVAVFGGIADVGATFAHFESGDPSKPLLHAGYEQAVPDGRARVVAVAGPIPADMIVVNPDVAMHTRISVAGALCRMPHDPVGKADLARVIGAEAFEAVSIQALQELEELMAESLALV